MQRLVSISNFLSNLKNFCQKIDFLKMFQVHLFLSDARTLGRFSSCEKEVSNIGPFRGSRSFIRKWTAYNRHVAQKVTEAEQTLAADRVGSQHRNASSQGRQNTRRLCRENAHRRAEQIPGQLRQPDYLRHY